MNFFIKKCLKKFVQAGKVPFGIFLNKIQIKNAVKIPFNMKKGKPAFDINMLCRVLISLNRITKTNREVIINKQVAVKIPEKGSLFFSASLFSGLENKRSTAFEVNTSVLNAVKRCISCGGSR